MARKAKDRVTNQEFPSCHSWESKRRQKLRIKLFSSQKKRRTAAPLQQTFRKETHISTCVEDIFGREGTFCFMINFVLPVLLFLLHLDPFAWWSTSERLAGSTLHTWRTAFNVIWPLWFDNFVKLQLWDSSRRSLFSAAPISVNGVGVGEFYKHITWRRFGIYYAD